MCYTSYQIMKHNLKLMSSMCDSFDLLLFIFSISLNGYISWEGPGRLWSRTRENAMKIFEGLEFRTGFLSIRSGEEKSARRKPDSDPSLMSSDPLGTPDRNNQRALSLASP